MATLLRHVDRFALSQQIRHAQTKLRLTPLDRSAHVGILKITLCLGPVVAPASCGLLVLLLPLVPPSFVLLARVGCEARACIRLQPFRAPTLGWHMHVSLGSFGSWPLSWPLRPPWKTPSRMAFRPSWMCLWTRLRFPPWAMLLRNVFFCVPVRARALSSRRPLPIVFVAPFFLSQRGLTGLSVKSCPAAPLDRSASSHRCSGSSASAAGFVKPVGAATAPRAPTPSVPRAVAVDPRQAATCVAMWACCDDTSSDDDEHNTSNSFLLLCADALIAPMLLSGLSDVDELMVALGCRFALDVFTIAQQGRPFAEPAPLPLGL